ncbi:MAG: ssDNA-binding protein, mitochondrial [Lichina confinis]|nr:MAG: ssDNA-binding protein, mitochondrial [Lichina confinis]
MVFSHASSSATRSLLLRPSTSSSSSVVGVGRSHQSGAVRCFSATRRAEIARASLVGTLVAAPEERTTDNGLESIRLKLASDWGPSTQRRTDWWTVHSYRKDPLAKQRMMSLKIGSLLYVDGTVRMVSGKDEAGRARSHAYLIESKYQVLRNPPGREGTAENVEVEQGDPYAIAADDTPGAAEDRVAAKSAHTT